MSKRARLVKVVVQPHFVIDDGETLEEFVQDSIIIPAADWPTYSAERFPREIAEWEKRLNAPPPRAERRRQARAKSKAPAKPRPAKEPA